MRAPNITAASRCCFDLRAKIEEAASLQQSEVCQDYCAGTCWMVAHVNAYGTALRAAHRRGLCSKRRLQDKVRHEIMMLTAALVSTNG